MNDVPKQNIIDAFCRVESGVIVERLINVTEENGQVTLRPITENDIVARGHPMDWYVRVQRVNSTGIPRYYKRSMTHTLVRNPDHTFGVEVSETPVLPTISGLLLDLKKEGAESWMDLEETGKRLLGKLIIKSFKDSILRMVQSRGYEDVTTAINFIGCHIEKYDREGRRIQYLLAEAWSKYEWYMEQLKADLIPFPTQASDILDHFPKLSWDDSVSAAEASTDPGTESTDTDTPSDDQTKA